MKKLFKKAIVSLMLIIAFISYASAQHCFSPSPTMQSGSKYQPIKTRELTETEYDNLNQFINSIVGNWRGTGKELKCSGSLSNPSQEIIRYTIQGKSIFDASGTFSLNAELYSAEKSSAHSERQDLYLTEKNFRAGSDNSGGDVEFIEISANRIRYRQIYSKKSGYGTFRGELFTTLSRNNNIFVFIRTYYFQGNHSRTKEWRLSKQESK